MTTLSLNTLFGIMTIVPLVAGGAVYALHLAGYATRRLAIALAVIAAAVPAICVGLLVSAVAPGDPVMVRPFGEGVGFGAWVAPAFRIDTLAIFAGVGCAFLVLPLVFWLTFAQRSAPEAADDDSAPEAEAADDAENAADAVVAASVPASAQDADTTETTETTESADDITTPLHSGRGGWRAFIGADDLLAPAAVRSLAFTGVLSAALLAAIFADSFVLAGVAWLVVVLAGWAIGEAASDREHLDRLGLGISLLGPLVWLIVLIIVGRSAHGTRFLQVTGTQPINVAESIILALAFALAAGAYPATSWIRRRAAFASPAGVGALVLTILPLAIYLGARTYALAADGQARWPIIGTAPTGPNAPPPITAGLAFALLGALTVAMAGLLALGRRDARALIALLAAAQVGWAMVALGAGTDASALGVVMLLATTVLGLGAMVASVVAGSAITSDVEPDADGPRPAGAPLRPASLAAWSIGAATLIGVPLFAGFVGRQLTSAGMLQAGGLNVPLGALCWAGDALLALALLRATAPALADQPKPATLETDDLAGDAAEDETTAEDETAPSAPRLSVREIPGAIFAVIALVAAILPGYALGLYGGIAADSLLGPGSVVGLVKANALGYSMGTVQWSSGIIWLAAVLLGAIALALQPAGSSRLLLPAIGAQAGAQRPESEDTATLAEPHESWHDLAGALDGEWTLPARGWLLDGIEGDDDDASDDESAAEPDPGPDDGEGVTVAARGEEVTHDDE